MLTITDVNKEVSALYATRLVLNSLITANGFAAQLDIFLTARLTALGSIPAFSTDVLNLDASTPIGIGNIAGNGLVAHLISDGSNQLGNLGGHKANRQRYRDYTNFKAVNPDAYIVDPRYWQPFFTDDGTGVFNYQEHVVPQLSLVPGDLT